MKLVEGTTERCLAHLAKAIQGRDFFEKRKMIADFVGVGDEAVHRWFKNGALPVGEQLVRMRFYLEFLGYKVSELDELDVQVRNAARLFAFGIVSLSEIADLLGYVEKSGTDSLLKIFRGTRGVSSEKIQQIQAFVELYEKQLDGKRRGTVSVLTATSDDRRSEEASIITRPSLRTVGEGHSTLIEALAAAVKAMLPLAEYVLSDSFTANERQRVRELAGGDGVSRLSLLLTKLSGEAARTALTNSSKKEAAL